MAFKEAYRLLNQRIDIFTSLPLRSLDRLTLRASSATSARWKAGRRPRNTPDGIVREAHLLGMARHGVPVGRSGRPGTGGREACGNVALALLCNTIPIGAILVVLILVFGPLSSAFQPGGEPGFRVARRTAVDHRHQLRCGLQLGGAIAGCVVGTLDVRTAGVATLNHRPAGLGAMDAGEDRGIWTATDDPGMCRRRQPPTRSAFISPPPIGSPPPLHLPIPP